MTAPALSVRASFANTSEREWLFGRNVDLLAFGGSALLAFALLAVGFATGALDRDAPAWLWLFCVVGVDVAHVWSTLFRVYLDGQEVRRRALLYLGLPILAYLAGLLLYGLSVVFFWRFVAYAAVFHFVRQQIGWMRLYHRRDASISTYERSLDIATLYASMIYPLLDWHARLPRRFAWMIDGDFIHGIPTGILVGARAIYVALLSVWCIRFVMHARATGRPAWGRGLLVVTTAVTWYVGIVALNSDFAFTVMNVFVHGIPYFVLTFRYGVRRGEAQEDGVLHRLARVGWPVFLLVVITLAFVEESAWDRWVWHDHPQFFGNSVGVGNTMLAFLVPLLATPQLTHYALDAVVWKRKGNE